MDKAAKRRKAERKKEEKERKNNIAAIGFSPPQGDTKM